MSLQPPPHLQWGVDLALSQACPPCGELTAPRPLPSSWWSWRAADSSSSGAGSGRGVMSCALPCTPLGREWRPPRSSLAQVTNRPFLRCLVLSPVRPLLSVAWFRRPGRGWGQTVPIWISPSRKSCLPPSQGFPCFTPGRSSVQREVLFIHRECPPAAANRDTNDVQQPHVAGGPRRRLAG